MKSKICGIPNLEVAENIIALKPNAIGIYCWQEAEKGANFTSFDTAAQIASLATASSVDSFYLTYATTAAEAAKECMRIGNSHVQLLGDISVQEITKLKQLLPELKTVKVVGITGSDSMQEASMYGDCGSVDQLLLDSRSGGIRGGTGKTHDWNISRHIVATIPKPIWLAGGIKLQNVTEAMSTVHPYGIDVETGVQYSDGTKNYPAIKEFVELVRSF